MSEKFYVNDSLQIYSNAPGGGEYKIPIEVIAGTIKSPLFVADSVTQAAEFVKYARAFPGKIKIKTNPPANRKSLLLAKQMSFVENLF